MTRSRIALAASIGLPPPDRSVRRTDWRDKLQSGQDIGFRRVGLDSPGKTTGLDRAPTTSATRPEATSPGVGHDQRSQNF